MKNKQNISANLITTLLALITLLADQTTKFIVVNYNINIKLGILRIHPSFNSGAAFGILQGQTFFLILISIAAIIAIIFYFESLNFFEKVFSGVFIGGVVGNLIDRIIFRKVTDFIDFGFWPSFNLADTAITLSVITIIIYSIIKKNNK